MKYLFTLLFILIASVLPAQEKFEITGFGSTGYKMLDQNRLRKFNQEAYYAGKLQFETKIYKHADLQIQLDGESDDSRIVLKEVSTKFDFFKKLKFKVGNIKRPFGAEQLTSEEDLIAIEKSLTLKTISKLGFGGRSVSLMGYYNYSKKRPEYPYSYYLSVFKDNSLNSGAAGRFSYHAGDIAYSLSYLLQHKGGDEAITTQGVETDLIYNAASYNASVELTYIQDPVESMRRQAAGLSNKVGASGARALLAKDYGIEGHIIKSIEPLLGFGFYIPDFNKTEYNTIQILAGANFYFDKNLRLRINLDGQLSKNIYNTDYSTIGSGIIIELQARF